MKIRHSFVFLMMALGCAGCAPTDADRQSLNDAFTKYDGRQLDEAESLTSNYIEKFPNEPNVDEAYYLRGLARYGKGNKPGASQDMLTALDKSKRDDLQGKSLLLLGDIAFEGQRWEQALDYFKNALEKYPAGNAPVSAYYRLGSSLQALGQWDKAKPYFTKTLASKPDDLLRVRALQRLNATNFQLQYAAFKEGPKAAEYVSTLKAQGISAIVASELRDNQFLFLVRSGKYSTWNGAEFDRTQLLKKHPLVIVVP